MLKVISAVGVGTAVFQRALADEAAKAGALTSESVAAAEWVAGMELTAEDRSKLVASLPGLQSNLQKLRAISCEFSDLPALRFDPEAADPAIRQQATAARPWLSPSDAAKSSATAPPATPPDDLSWLPIRTLASMIRARQITSEQLTRHCLDRLMARRPETQLRGYSD
jgi:hypothetical protein